MKSCKNLKGGLQEVAAQLEIARLGAQHQAGSDSLLTGLTFFKMKEVIFIFEKLFNFLTQIDFLIENCKKFHGTNFNEILKHFLDVLRG